MSEPQHNSSKPIIPWSVIGRLSVAAIVVYCAWHFTESAPAASAPATVNEALTFSASTLTFGDGKGNELVRVGPDGKVTMNGDPTKPEFWNRFAEAMRIEHRRAEATRWARCDRGEVTL